MPERADPWRQTKQWTDSARLQGGAPPECVLFVASASQPSHGVAQSRYTRGCHQSFHRWLRRGCLRESVRWFAQSVRQARSDLARRAKYALLCATRARGKDNQSAERNIVRPLEKPGASESSRLPVHERRTPRAKATTHLQRASRR